MFDFHALRGALISRAERSGATVKTLQGPARHSDPRLTLKRYARLRLEDEVATLDAMPGSGRDDDPTVDTQAAKATGTHDATPRSATPIATPVEAPAGARNGANGCGDARPSRLRLAGGDERHPLENKAKREDIRGGAAGSGKYPVRDLNSCRRRERAKTPSVSDARDGACSTLAQADTSSDTNAAQNHPSEDPDLARVVEAWPALDEATRRAVTAIVQATGHRGG